MGNKLSLGRKSANSSQSVYHQILSEGLNCSYQSALILDYHIRILLKNHHNDDETDYILLNMFPSTIKPLILEYLSFSLPTVLLYLQLKVKQTSNDYKEIGLFKLSGRTRIISEVKQILFHTQSISYHCDMQFIEKKLKQLNLSCHEYAKLICIFFNELNCICFQDTKYGGMLGDVETEQNFKDKDKYEKITNDIDECVDYLNKVIFDKQEVCKKLYWWLMELLGQVAMQQNQNKMNVRHLASALVKAFSYNKRETKQFDQKESAQHAETIEMILELSIESQMEEK